MSAAEVLPAIILRTRPLGDADLLVILLSPTHGKLETAATRARGSTRRFAGGLHPGMIGEATLSRGRGALLRLGGFTPRRSHAAVGQDLHRFAYVAYLCELCDELVLPRQADPRLYAALDRSLEALISRHPRVAELRRFEFALLDTLGLLPAFTRCCACGEPVAGEAIAFDGHRGGALCGRHGDGAPTCPAAVLSLAEALVTEGDGEEPGEEPDEGDREDRRDTAVDRVEAAPPELRRALRDLSVGLLRVHLRRPLRSLTFLAQLPPLPLKPPLKPPPLPAVG